MPHIDSRRKQTNFQWLIEALKIQTNECQIWPFSKDAYGYGTVAIKRKATKAHRLAQKLTDSAFDDSLQTLHRCDNPPCFNPRHLFQGTHADNMADMVAKQRRPFGEKHEGAKLSEVEVREIRARYDSGESRSSIARDYPVGYMAIWQITSKKKWKHIV